MLRLFLDKTERDRQTEKKVIIMPSIYLYTEALLHVAYTEGFISEGIIEIITRKGGKRRYQLLCFSVTVLNPFPDNPWFLSVFSTINNYLNPGKASVGI